MGLYDRPAKGSRRSGSSEKTRRNVSLEFRFGRNPDVRRGIGFLRLINAEEIEISLECTARACADFEGFETGITYLQTSTILTVLNDSVVDLEFPLCCMHLVGPSSKKVKFSQRPYIPVVIWLVHQRRFWKDRLQTPLIAN